MVSSTVQKVTPPDEANNNPITMPTAKTPTKDPSDIGRTDRLWCRIFEHDYIHALGGYTLSGSPVGMCRNCGETISDEELALHALNQEAYPSVRLNNATKWTPLDKEYIRAVADAHGINYEYDDSADDE